MIKLDNLNLPVMLTHEVNGVQYKIGGFIKSINESEGKCDVLFSHGRIEKIPFEHLYITEGVWDKLKELGKSISTWFIKKVKGFIAFCDKAGRYAVEPFNNIYNRAIAANKGELPVGAYFYPGQIVIDQLAEVGVTVPEVKDNKIFEYGIKKDAEAVNAYWHSVMSRAATSDDTIEESIDYVNKKYKMLKEDGINSLEEPVNKNMRTKKMYGKEVNTSQLKGMIIENITSQLNYYRGIEAGTDLGSSGDAEYDAMFDEIDNPEIDQKLFNADKKQFKEILFVWGAPGIGKTAIITQTLAELKQSTMTVQDGKTLYGRNLCLCTVNCSGFSDDSFMMPSPADEVEVDYKPNLQINLSDEADKVTTKLKNNNFKAAPLSWLPVYIPTGDERDALMEQRFMTCQHLSVDGATPLKDSEGDVYTGGILFLDEVLRCRATALNSIMALGRRNIQGYKLADSWAIICASNRGFESPDQEGLDLLADQAQMQTFVHVNFVPTREEWLEWAKSPNATGWRSVIDSRVLEFIERGTSKHWYRCVSFGGYDDEIAQALGDNSEFVQNLRDKSPDEPLTSDIVDRLSKLKDEKNPLKTSVHWDGRILHAISREYQNAQIALFNYKHKEPSGIWVDGTLDNGDEARENRAYRYDYKYLVMQSVFGECPVDKEKAAKWIAQVKEHIKDYKYMTTGVNEDMYQKALAHLKPGVWESWCKVWLPSDIAEKVKDVDPTTLNFSRDIMDEVLLHLVSKYTKDNYNNSFLYNSLKADLEWRDKFTDAVIESIYKFGWMPKENGLRKSDEWNQFEWKKSGKERERKQIVDFLITNYPGNITDEFSAYETTIKSFLTNLDNNLKGIEGRKNIDFNRIIKETIDNLQDVAGKVPPYSDALKKNMNALFSARFFTNANNAQRRKPVTLPLIDIDEVAAKSPQIFRMLYFLCTKKKFVYRMVNVVKYIISMLDLNLDNRHYCGEWQGENNGEVDAFMDYFYNLVDINNALQLEERANQGNISLILGNFKNNDSLKYLYLVDVFRLLMSCNKAAANFVIKTGVLGKDA